MQISNRGYLLDIGIIELLQNRDNAGLCPFLWQELTVFNDHDLAGSCQRLKLLTWNNLSVISGWENGVDPAVLFRDFCQTVAKRVNDEFEAVGDL